MEDRNTKKDSGSTSLNDDKVPTDPSSWDILNIAALGIGAVALVTIDLFLLASAPTLHSALERLATTPNAAAAVSSAVAGTSTVAPPGQSGPSAGIAEDEPSEDEPFNWLEKCLAGIEPEPPPTGKEPLAEALLKALRGFVTKSAVAHVLL